MASASSKSSAHFHIRSISLPCRSHPATLKIEEGLNKIKTRETSSPALTAEAICNGLSRLGELYKCMDELLNLPLTMQALSQHQNEKWVDEFLDKSVKLLDICGITRDMVSQSKENVRDLQSSLRRRKGDLAIETSITKYTSFRKKLKKDAKRSTAALKQMDQEINPTLTTLDVDQHVSALIKVLREVNSTTTSIFQTVLNFLSLQSSKSKTSKWSLVSRLMHKGRVACENQKYCSNELESVDAAICSLCKNDRSEVEKLQFVQHRLETLEASMGAVENELEAMFRGLIRSRTTLLNVFFMLIFILAMDDFIPILYRHPDFRGLCL